MVAQNNFFDYINDFAVNRVVSVRVSVTLEVKKYFSQVHKPKHKQSLLYNTLLHCITRCIQSSNLSCLIINCSTEKLNCSQYDTYQTAI